MGAANAAAPVKKGKGCLVAFGVFCLFFGVCSYLGNAEAEREELINNENARASAAAAAQAQAETNQRLAALLTACQTTVPATAEPQVAAAEAAFNPLDIPTLQSTVIAADTTIRPCYELSPWPAGIVTLDSRLTPPRDFVVEFAAAAGLIANAETNLGLARGFVEAEDWLLAYDAFVVANGQLASISEPMREHFPEWADKNRESTRAMDRYRDRAERIREERAEQQAYQQLCGPGRSVERDRFNAYRGLAASFRATAHDPDSVEVSDCTAIILTEENCWQTRCTLRARNGFGALVASRSLFQFVVNADNWAVVTNVINDLD